MSCLTTVFAQAVRGAHTGSEFSLDSISVGIVSEDRPFTVLGGDELKQHFDAAVGPSDAMATD